MRLSPLTARDGRRHRRLALAGLLALALVTVIGMTFGSSADAKKKKKGPSVYQATQSPNAAIPNNPTTSIPSTPFVSTFTVGKKFKGKTVGDVNVTGITTTGSGSGAANDLGFRITGPTGRAVTLIKVTGIGDVSIGPLTLDDDTPVSICDQDPGNPCSFYPNQLNRPFAGTANLEFLGVAGTGPLSAFDGLPMRGNWLLTVWDQSGNPTTSALNSWGLQITAARPVK
jgi:hypothetical protein